MENDDMYLAPGVFLYNRSVLDDRWRI